MPANNNQKPVIFLAFANDLDAGYLYRLKEEKRQLEEALTPVQDILCEVVVKYPAALRDILKVFQDRRFRDRIAVFHYGGHAEDYRLLLESDSGGRAANSNGLVPFLSGQRSLQLVFINGCSTKPHALELMEAGIPMVIGTSEPVDDAAATLLSGNFYRALAQGIPLARAWQEAVAGVNSTYGRAALYRVDRGGQRRRADDLKITFPWEAYYREGAEAVKEWNLPAAAGNPLFGVPEIPEKYYKSLPPAPFIGLNHFSQREAGIFFGRGKDIRELYNRITGMHPLILFYGQSGVGKSSLLVAGLVPRIETQMAVCYARRGPELGLSGTLRQVLAACEDTGKNPDLYAAWQTREAQEGRPLLVILDQAEEAYTRTLPREAGEENEWDIFLSDLIHLFQKPVRPLQGKLILSYRKEYHPEISKTFRERRLSYAPLFLQQLDHAGIIEAVEGITRDNRLRELYNLEIESSSGVYLPGSIVDDLLADRGSPVAPMLQILLTNLWNAAIGEDPGRPHFRIERYYEIRKQGLAMEDFLNQQLDKLRAWNADVVDSGLVLDLVHYHTTALGTARSRRCEEIEAAYGDRPALIAELLEQCRSLYLLTGRYPDEPTRLAHDTLAPVVIRAFQDSDRPGQRAARILNVKVREIIYRIPENALKNLVGHSKETKERLQALTGNDFRGRSKLTRVLQDTLGDMPELTSYLLEEAKWDYGSGEDKVSFSPQDIMVLETGLPGMRRLRPEEVGLLQRGWKEVYGVQKWIDWILKKRDYYNRTRNAEGKGIKHKYQVQAGGQVVFDGATGLMWQQSGSNEKMTYDKVKSYVNQLNRKKFAGFNGWRLPSLEEAMGLLEPINKGNNLYINPIFDEKQMFIWTSGPPFASGTWLILFDDGDCYHGDYIPNSYVRAVRSGQ
ncbi:MAG: DUF1566 domain-containing protein [Calditrichaeota bacterium]|nr:DUF1566 domain-containing protein [Calditrichota bacterium]MCB0294300.1 DUF1566 domain-containing protein [Calditrichota bacterium]MCB0304066.1 DUF1566 domain-containing protein [Calditrichota bacterium]